MGTCPEEFSKRKKRKSADGEVFSKKEEEELSIKKVEEDVEKMHGAVENNQA